MRQEELGVATSDPTINICLDTLARKKQALIFCNTKRGAESQAERLATKVKHATPAWEELAEEARIVLATPTKQCERLARCLRKGAAFHHAGLHQRQRTLIEEAFRDGRVAVICSTPTLAQGLDLPAFRVVVRDLKRYGGHGMQDIPVLEYEQMAGRAGRPGQEAWGEAITLAQTADQEEEVRERYLRGEPESIYSKLAVEPVLRTYVLSLIAGGFISSKEGLWDFFDRTFYAAQFGDLEKLHGTLERIVGQLRDWEFLEGHADFVSADEMGDAKLRATMLGKRVAELYLDPYTAHSLQVALQRAMERGLRTFPALHMLASCLELRPLLRPRTRELDDLIERLVPEEEHLLVPEPVQWSPDYDEFLMSVKTAFFLEDWANEVYEDALLERYNIGPGEVHAKLERCDWLLYACEELARLLSFQQLRAPLSKLRLRVKYGAREELLPLLKLKNVGRVRARKLVRAGIRTLRDLKGAEHSTLAALLGPRVAKDVLRQVGRETSAEKVAVKPRKRKGQKSMRDYEKA